MRFKNWLESQASDVLYHYSPRRNRQSILKNGLQTQYDQTMEKGQPGVVGGIYLTNKPDVQTNSDVWKVDVRGLELEEDWTTSPDNPEENWYVLYQDIPPNRLKLLSP